jgi:hypothetical protein
MALRLKVLVRRGPAARSQDQILSFESSISMGVISVFLALVVGWRVRVRLKGTGDFFCLHCEKERSYQHREWRGTESLFFIPVSASGGEFVRCDTCENAFTLECLNESSTAFWHELLADAPDSAIHTRLLAALPDEPSGRGTRYAEPQWERGSRSMKSLSATSGSRRH